MRWFPLRVWAYDVVQGASAGCSSQFERRLFPLDVVMLPLSSIT
jgi:hypothetical protein